MFLLYHETVLKRGLRLWFVTWRGLSTVVDAVGDGTDTGDRREPLGALGACRMVHGDDPGPPKLTGFHLTECIHELVLEIQIPHKIVNLIFL